jgi:putative ABC transport system permease protein
MIPDLIRIALTNIVHRSRRSLLTVIGVAVGIAAVVSLVSLGQGLESSIQQQAEEIGADKIFIGTSSSEKLENEELEAVRSVKQTGEAAGIIFTSTAGTYDDERSFITLIGVRPEYRDLFRNSYSLDTGPGRGLRPADTSSTVLGSDLRENVFGQEVSLRSSVTIEGEDLKTIGFYEATGDPSVDRAAVTTYSQARDLLERDETYDDIVARVQDGFTPEEAAEEVEKRLRDINDLEGDVEIFSVQTQEELVSSFGNILAVVSGVVTGIASISLLVGSVNIMNTMYTSVTQRTSEIGLMKAIGASRRQILSLFVLESGFIGVTGGVIGLSIGTGMSLLGAELATRLAEIQITAVPSPLLASGTLLLSFVLGVFSGVLPARKAAKLPPEEALRYE